ncbi:hypothetical protein ACFXPR_00425 [Nocardia tengchongensis]|uniref:hypothetical protein n=1 Tax=Nocardia tengchongensis TaxID=2055889 RepID=UPI0036CF1247
MSRWNLRRRAEPAITPVDPQQRLDWRIDALALDYPHPRTRALIDADTADVTDTAAPEATGATR